MNRNALRLIFLCAVMLPLLSKLAMVLLEPVEYWLHENALLSDLESDRYLTVWTAMSELGKLRSVKAIGPVLRLSAHVREHPCVAGSAIDLDTWPAHFREEFVVGFLEREVSDFLKHQIEARSSERAAAVEDLLLTEVDAEVLRRACSLLGDLRMPTDRGRTILRDLQSHEDAGVRQAAAEALQKIEAARG